MLAPSSRVTARAALAAVAAAMPAVSCASVVSVGATNGFDSVGHVLRSNLQLTSCVEVAVSVQSGCEAFFRSSSTTPAPTKKKSKKAKVSGTGLHSAPLPQVDVPNLRDLIPQVLPQPTPPTTTPTTPDDSGTGSGSDTTTPQDDQTGQSDKKGTPDGQAVSMNEAQMFLQFLLGGGA